MFISENRRNNQHSAISKDRANRLKSVVNEINQFTNNTPKGTFIGELDNIQNMNKIESRPLDIEISKHTLSSHHQRWKIHAKVNKENESYGSVENTQSNHNTYSYSKNDYRKYRTPVVSHRKHSNSPKMMFDQARSKKSGNNFTFYDTKMKNSYFGDTIKNKQYLDLNELLEDTLQSKSHTLSNTVRKSTAPIKPINQSPVTHRVISIKTNRILHEKAKMNQQSTIPVSREPNFDKKRCQSTLTGRRNWNTSARKNADDDSPLDLSKRQFGIEYRNVLDKFLEPKLPDNRKLK